MQGLVLRSLFGACGIHLSSCTQPRYLVATADLELDEELIKYGFEEDVWFHVDNLSSAHIYVRLPEGENWENISQELLTDCAQLTKANSIEGTYPVWVGFTSTC